MSKLINSLMALQVNSSVLDNMIVGLHYFLPFEDSLEQTKLVLEAWNYSRKLPGKKLAIVVVPGEGHHISYCKALYEKKFGSPMPWYSLLPTNYIKLLMVFYTPILNRCRTVSPLIILQNDKFEALSYFGFEILENYGVGAYPYTLEVAVKIETEKQKSVMVLRELLTLADPLRVGHSDDVVCLSFHSLSCCRTIKL